MFTKLFLIKRILLVSLLLCCLFLIGSCTTSTSEKTLEPKVYVTNTGNKYHSQDCFYLSRSKKAIGLYQAQSKHYSACSYCHGTPNGYIEVSYKTTKTNNCSETTFGLVLIIAFGSCTIYALIPKDKN